jgi:CubicO group peptidase (beta-lactamase class C family)
MRLRNHLLAVRHRMHATKVICLAAMTLFAVNGGELRQNNAMKGVLKTIADDAMKRYDLKSLIVQVRYNGKNAYTEAFGDSMTGVPATPHMHFRNGAMALTYMSTMLLELIDQRPTEVSLDDKLSKYLPGLPEADRITLKNLANMTSGYADYVYQPEVLHGVNLNPFRQWTSEELIQIGISKPMQFEPGTNWGYSHTNYVILGRVLEKITCMPLAEAMRNISSIGWT